jgi:hypothetical protein
MRNDPPDQAIETKRRQGITPITVTIRLGCEFKEEIYRSRRLGTIGMTQRKTWLERFAVPEKGYKKRNLVCPICHSAFEMKVYSKAKARRRKLYFASCFIMIATCGIAFGVYAGREKGLMGYSMAAPFILFAAWQLLNAIRGRFDPSDVVCHVRGRTHRIYGDRKISFSD